MAARGGGHRSQSADRDPWVHRPRPGGHGHRVAYTIPPCQAAVVPPDGLGQVALLLGRRQVRLPAGRRHGGGARDLRGARPRAPAPAR
eukprot:4351807-Alexandrium_andersonii.AAC.1